ALPGPKILSTFGTLSVPYAIAAMECAPPILNTVSMPHSSAATSTAGFTPPFVVGAEQSTRFGQPTSCAGTPLMITAEGSRDTPEGMERPPAGIGRTPRSQRTPGIVSSERGAGSCTL